MPRPTSIVTRLTNRAPQASICKLARLDRPCTLEPMRKWLFLSFLVAGCGFSGGKDTPDAAPTDGPPADSTPPVTYRRIQLTIPAGEVMGPLAAFPVYVSLPDHADLKAKLDATASNLSFRTLTGAVLPHELQRYDATTGSLQAWVKLPVVELEAGSDTVFELRYGPEAVKAAPAPAVVWADYYAVFHFEQKPDIGVSLTNSAAAGSPGTPTDSLDDADDYVDAQLGKGYHFNGNDEWVTFANPVAGNVSTTISAWVNQRATNDNEVVLLLGADTTPNARILYSRFGNSDYVANDRGGNDFTSSSTSIINAQWKLVHWSYNTNRQATMFLDGQTLAGTVFTHPTDAATTAGGLAFIGTSDATASNRGAKATLDEIRIAKNPLSQEWAAAEFRNQSAPTTFVVASAPVDAQQ